MNSLPLPGITHGPGKGRRLGSSARLPSAAAPAGSGVRERSARGCAGRAWRSVGSEPTQDGPGAPQG